MNQLLLVGGEYDQRTLELSWLPATMQFEGEMYRKTNVHVPPRHDDGGIRRQVYLYVAVDNQASLTDEEILDLLDDGRKGGECGGA